MALTESEAKVLGALSDLDTAQTLTVRELHLAVGLSEQSVRRALARLLRTGLAASTRQSPANWWPTARGRLTAGSTGYREYAMRAAR
ncbi:hypothetical protein ACFXHA_14995 [Nocardia sp. NPDC059240]|uniref:hypothetical protein n=1 Tax=Nocardia sp. NPDC059240 TaxID=3346786 RepID=UPI0036B60D15